MFELLCKNRNPEPSDQELEMSYSGVMKLYKDSKKEASESPLSNRMDRQLRLSPLLIARLTASDHWSHLPSCLIIPRVQL